MTSQADPPRHRTPLFQAHAELGARLAAFGDWQMPIEYAGGGVLKEHQAVRERVGLFDVSHLGKVEVSGPGAAAFVDSCLTNTVGKLVPGRAQYTLCCEESGGVVDDLFLYLRSSDDVLLVPNAANAAEVTRRLAAAAPPDVRVLDRHHDLVVLAVQGPRSDEVLAAVGLPSGHDYLRFVTADWNGQEVVVCRTGYTGERGYELLAPSESAPALWKALLDRVRREGGLPVGLGARDTLRTEMGYPLHGHELSLQITPVQARVAWAVGWDKPAFWGREVLVAERARGPARVARGLLALERGVPRPEMDVVPAGAGSGPVLGRTTSGTFSPTLGVGIALALLDPAVQDGSEVAIDVRGRPVRARVIKPPFVAVNTRQA
jgi:aminomethyltransferase